MISHVGHRYITFIIIRTTQGIDGVVHDYVPILTSEHLEDSQEGRQETVEVDPGDLLREHEMTPEQLHAEERKNKEEEEEEEQETDDWFEGVKKRCS